MSVPPSPLISLPFEVRTLVYQAIIGSPPPSIIIQHDHASNSIKCYKSTLSTAWLRTCRVLHSEGWALIGRLVTFVWSLHLLHDRGTPYPYPEYSFMNSTNISGLMKSFNPNPRNQLHELLSTTFIRKLHSLEVAQSCLPPKRELLSMWKLQSLTIQHFRRDDIGPASNWASPLHKILDEEEMMDKAIASLTYESKPENMPFLRSRTKFYIKVLAEFFHRDHPQYWGQPEDKGFCISMGLKFELKTRTIVEKDVWVIEKTTGMPVGFSDWPSAGIDIVEKINGIERKLLERPTRVIE